MLDVSNAYMMSRCWWRPGSPDLHVRPRYVAHRVTGLIVGMSVALSGCETATAIKDKAVEAATTAGSFISTQASHAADFVMGRKSGSLVDDGTSCFGKTRVPFYAAVDEVTQAQRLE